SPPSKITEQDEIALIKNKSAAPIPRIIKMALWFLTANFVIFSVVSASFSTVFLVFVTVSLVVFALFPYLFAMYSFLIACFCCQREIGLVVGFGLSPKLFL